MEVYGGTWRHTGVHEGICGHVKFEKNILVTEIFKLHTGPYHAAGPPAPASAPGDCAFVVPFVDY